jgi:hypothetical protein
VDVGTIPVRSGDTNLSLVHSHGDSWLVTPRRTRAPRASCDRDGVQWVGKTTGTRTGSGIGIGTACAAGVGSARGMSLALLGLASPSATRRRMTASRPRSRPPCATVARARALALAVCGARHVPACSKRASLLLKAAASPALPLHSVPRNTSTLQVQP